MTQTIHTQCTRGFTKRIIVGATCLSIATLAIAAESNQAPRTIRLGPIELGMRIHEIRAALPDVQWKLISKSEFTGREFKVSAEDAIALAGRRMKVDVRDHPYEWDVGLTASFNEAGPEACEKTGLEVLTALEEGTGRLAASRGDSETVSFGKASTARFAAFEGRREVVARKYLARSAVNTLVLSAQFEAKRQEVKATVTFDAANPKNCLISVMAIGWQEQPPWQAVPYDERKVIKRMLVGDQHRLASGVTLPENGVVVPMQCQVSRQSGKVLLCNELGDRPYAPAVSNIAGRYAGAMAFDMTGIDRDNPQPVLIDIPVRVSTSDVKSLDFGQAPLLKMAELTFTATLPEKEIQYAYPIKALRKGVGARVGLICQIQTDGSLICQQPIVRQADGQSDLHPDFASGAANLIPLYQSATTLKNGAPSAGKVFGLSLQFGISE